MMQSILGIDAAWTRQQPSGVALVRGDGMSWTALAAAPSYDAFLAIARGASVDWTVRPTGTSPHVGQLVEAARQIGGCDVRLVALDMPVAKVPFSGRRAADNAVSRRFGSTGCAAHTPTADRPGRLGELLTADLSELGFSLATTAGEVASGPCLVEVYPHPALLSLLRASYRIPYKVSGSNRYWPGRPPQERRRLLLEKFIEIHDELSNRIGPLPLDLEAAKESSTLSELKRHEDALDALLCTWIGTTVLSSTAEPLGDESSAVWVPYMLPES
jgi:predicted RNase H-like nuclease